MKTKLLSIIFFLVLIFDMSCTKKENNELSAFKPEITNKTDDFQLQATNVENTTTSITYTWKNSGSKANIDKSGINKIGSAKLTIFDSTGQQVYTTDLKSTGSENSSTGAIGDWKIQLDLSNYSGTLNFRVQKGG